MTWEAQRALRDLRSPGGDSKIQIYALGEIIKAVAVNPDDHEDAFEVYWTATGMLEDLNDAFCIHDLKRALF